MQLEPSETFQPASQTNAPSCREPTSQYGLPRPQPDTFGGHAQHSRSRSPSPGASATGAAASADALDADQLEERLRRLSFDSSSSARKPRYPIAGQRIFEYENAVTPTSPRNLSRHPLGFQVIKRAGSPSTGVQLTDFPNEILTHIISHLHPDSHGSVALVSKRFYAIVTTPYAWRAAFLRYFPGQDSISATSKQARDDWEDESDRVKSEFRYFARLTNLASWRSEYLLRTRLLRSIARGKPGANAAGSGISRPSQSVKKSGAVLTYNSKLPWIITNVHAVFSAAGKRPPRVVHGAAEMGVGTMSDPTIGKVEKWGLDDPNFFAQLDEIVPNLEPYGVGEGPAATPNVMDVSSTYGLLAGEGFPGGRVYFRATDERRGRYLGQDNASAIIDMTPEIPKIPELIESISSVWIAKSSAVPSMTHAMIGIMAGSSLGVVTTYALGHDSSGPRYSSGEMTARWVLSPGVPIISIKVDDSYNHRRKSLKRVWAVALNALGELFYLCETPAPPPAGTKGEDVVKQAWHNGRSVYWELIESTRRAARPDDFDKNAIRGAYSPRSPASSMMLSKEQTVAEAREIEKFLRFKPSHFRRVCEGWDMRRKLEVDFTGGDETGAGEAIVVMACGHAKGEPIGIRRYTRRRVVKDVSGEAGTVVSAEAEAIQSAPSIFGNPEPAEPANTPASIFGGPDTASTPRTPSPPNAPRLKPKPSRPPPTPEPVPAMPDTGVIEEWREAVFAVKPRIGLELTSSAIDMTNYALVAPFEDHMLTGPQTLAPGLGETQGSRTSTAEFPGRRSRMLAVGTNTGVVVVWNMRDISSGDEINPVRVIQTDSPSISCLALSALYLVHGGSDGLVQTWDPLASTLEPIRTLNAKSSGRIPRNIANANPALRHADYSAVGAIYLDPDPTSLRGVVAYGTFLRSWTYSSNHQAPGRKRRLRHSDIHGRLASRRHGGTVSSYIAAETAELRHEQQDRIREQTRLRNRFGVGFGEMTEEEAIRYAQMISEESFLEDEHRRLSASDTGSAADIGETTSMTGSSSADTITPEPSISGTSPLAQQSSLPPLQEETDDGYEAQIQRAIRLSLLEGVNDLGQSPKGNSSGEYEFQVKTKSKKGRGKGKRSTSASPSPSQIHTPLVQHGESSRVIGAFSSSPGVNPDDDLELALALSLQEEEEARQAQERAVEDSPLVGLGINEPAIVEEEFPALEFKGKGKGKML
ncbi:hypothetical protein GQ53DRAFT_87753 [Thozetella sp. PMI_491]|nr:hypothetical protein GQ53DRAFT_87753 [Thozetella sp. PMI_491]